MTKKTLKFGELSIDQVRSEICALLAQRYGNDEYPWVRDMYPESETAVFERAGKLYRVKYSIEGTNVSIANETEEVTQEYVPATEMADLGGQWFEIFKPGDFGAKGSYTSEDVDKFVANYDPAQHEAPLVIGHPENDKPAYGWISQLKNEGGVLLAKAKQVDPTFEELVKSGRFKKRSVGFYRTDRGPVLRHVGFLGAMPPEVKGMKDLKLCEFSDGEFVEFNFGEDEVQKDELKKTVAESVKEFFAEIFGKKEQAQAAADPALEAKFNELQTKVVELTTKLTESQQKQQTAATANLAEDAVKDLKAKQKWIPAFDAMGVPQIFAEMAKSEAKVTFGEGDTKTEKPMLTVFSDFLAGLQEIVPSKEIASGASQAKKGGKLIKFNEPTSDRHVVVGMEEADAAKQLQQKEKISYGEALQRVRTQGIEKEGGAAAGAV